MTTGTTRTSGAGSASIRRGPAMGSTSLPRRTTARRSRGTTPSMRATDSASPCRGRTAGGSAGRDQVVDPNTGFLRFAGDEVGVEHFVPGPGAVTFVGVDPAVCPGLFEDVVEVPAFTVTPEMALMHLRLVNGQRLGPTTSRWKRSHSSSSARRSSNTTAAFTPIRAARRANLVVGSSPKPANYSTIPVARSGWWRLPAPSAVRHSTCRVCSTRSPD